MKRSNDEIYFEETNRKELKLTTSTITCQVIIILDQTIGSNLLHHKFKYQTTELQLFLQNVPVLNWYPLQLMGTTFDTIDACVFSAVIRNTFHDPSNYSDVIDIVDAMLDFCCNDDTIFDDVNMHSDKSITKKTRKQKLANLLKSLLNDELFILQALREYQQQGDDSNPLEYISDQLKDDEKFMLKAIKIIGDDAIKYASDRLRKRLDQSANFEDEDHEDQEESDDEDDGNDHQLSDDDKVKIILESIKSTSKLEPYILNMLIENNYHLFRSFNRLNDNEQIVQELIKHYTRGFQYISNRLKDDGQFLLKLYKHNYPTLEFMSDRLKDDEEFVLQAVKLNGKVLQYVSDRLQDNEQIVMEAVKQKGVSIEYASDRLKDNELIILEAVIRDGDALQCASDRFKDNEEIVLEAVKQRGITIQYVSKDNEEIVLQAVKQNYNNFKYASDRLKDSEQIVLEVLKQSSKAFEYASNRLRNDEEFVLQLVKQNAYALSNASDQLKDNEMIVLEAIKQDSYSLLFASDRLKNDFNFAKEIFNNCNTFEVFEHFGEELRNIEFIYYYIENYQSKFHELMRKNTCKRESNAYTYLLKILDVEDIS